jgi:hypothetical protein
MLFAFAVFALFSTARSFAKHEECGSREPLYSDIEFEQRVSANNLRRRDITFPFELQVYVFVISAPHSSTYTQLEVTDTMVLDQISVISTDYESVFSINLMEIVRVTNSSWVPLVKDSEEERYTISFITKET